MANSTGLRTIQSGPLRGTGQYVVAVDGIDALKNIDDLSDKVTTFAMRAVNYATGKARTRASELMRQQVNFTASYLSPSQGRLTQGRPATATRLESNVTGRFAPTSLARFVVGNPKVGVPGVKISMKKGGSPKEMKRAFILNLRQGKVLDVAGGVFNRGLAIRLKPGERVEGRYQTSRGPNGLTLLYGVSVDQLLSTIAPEMLPEVEDWLNYEFNRLMDQFNKGNVF